MNISKLNKIIFIHIIIFICIPYKSILYSQDSLTKKGFNILPEPADSMMKKYLTNIVDKQFAMRDSILSTLKTAKDWDKRSQVIRDSILSWTGPLPERTPLNARITGRIERDDYIIEKILFESRPNYYVSANLYLPKNDSISRPALLNVIGHERDGKADERYQKLSIAKVKNGFVVLTIDGLGHGERGDGSTAYHRPIGTQAFISGTHLFNIMVWDAIRSIDYLISRPEVDADKISMTGSSGGGMLTTYILPFEDRIAISVPTTNPNTWSYRVHADLGTDHEQVFFGAFESGIDPRGDPLFVHVPKPLLLNTTTDDILNPPYGVWNLSTWLYKSYASYGKPEKFTTTMVKAGHDYNQEQREITAAWLLRWTDNDSSDFWEEEYPIEKVEDLWAAPDGNVFNVDNSRNNQELILEYYIENKSKWGDIKTFDELRNHKLKMNQLINSVLNMDINDSYFSYEIEDKYSKGDIDIQTFILNPEKEILLPGVILASNKIPSNNKLILYLNENGKSELIKDIDIVEELLSNGYKICAVDLRGIGETTPDMANRFWDFLAGKPIFGQRVNDILTIIKWFQESELEVQHINLWGSGITALYGAFAGALSGDISGFIFENPLLSFESVMHVNSPEYNHDILLPGILEEFDMSQVYQAIAPLPILIINPLLGDKVPAKRSDFANIEVEVSTLYQALNSKKAWSIQVLNSDEREEIITRTLLSK